MAKIVKASLFFLTKYQKHITLNKYGKGEEVWINAYQAILFPARNHWGCPAIHCFISGFEDCEETICAEAAF